ncbi:MAG TPA: sigma 54-interacting transcriptional regulator [Syntrophorhabdaceae bacterium]|nr:sigma 54-interacting transcriptional regulator [Syntrophorhabdaceae bacterium]
MNADENEFFREMTLRICGTLDLENALWQCFLYVRNIMPADELILIIYDPAIGTVDVVATANENGGVTRMDKTHLPPELRQEIEEAYRRPRVRIAENVFDDPILGRIARNLGWDECSMMLGRLIIDGKYVGAFGVRAAGAGRYTEDHVRLWSLVNEPAAIALANSRRHHEVTDLKDLLADDNSYLRDELRKNTVEIVGADFGLRNVMESVRKVAPLASPVLLVGETGTGKEVIANAIHNLSPRYSGPFVKVNCGAIPESLIDSELFGHEKGAFTGALARKRGRFERAHGGTIFLDEISELPPHAQVRLLRVLQEKEIERVGGTEPVKIDIRIISATNRDLEKMVEEGDFRGDLFFRIKVFPIEVPPLRVRKNDIPALVQHFIRKKSREMVLHNIPTLAPGAIDALMAYNWPGNVREVENAVERALILSADNPLNFDGILSVSGSAPDKSNAASYVDKGPLALQDVEADHIRRILEMTGGRVEGTGGAAELLGVNPGTLRHRMRKLRIPFGRKSKP